MLLFLSNPLSRHSFASQLGGGLFSEVVLREVKSLLALPGPEHQNVETHLSSDQESGDYPPDRRVHPQRTVT